MEEIEEKYRMILSQRLQESWYKWTEAEKAARTAKAVYESDMREFDAFEERRGQA